LEVQLQKIKQKYIHSPNGLFGPPVQDNLLNSKLNVRMGKKGKLSNFERGMFVGARWAGLSISQSSQVLGFSLTTISLEMLAQIDKIASCS